LFSAPQKRLEAVCEKRYTGYQDMTSQKTIIFIGCQGSGKGTQAHRLKEYLEAEDSAMPTFLFGIGEKFREITETDGYTENRIKDFLQTGKILPVFLPVSLWSGMFAENVRGNEHILFDGSPRTRQEAEVLDSAFDFYSREKVAVVNLEISHEETIQRLMKRGRADDTKEAIEERVSLFDSNIAPVLDFFFENSRYKILAINGEQTPDEVFEEIIISLQSA
jgi:adenylate kinase